MTPATADRKTAIEVAQQQMRSALHRMENAHAKLKRDPRDETALEEWDGACADARVAFEAMQVARARK